MQQEVQLICKKKYKESYSYEMCREGLAFLRNFNNKKLRIIFNITHYNQSLSFFNPCILDQQKHEHIQEVKPTVCLTISKHAKDIGQERVIIILNAYEQPKQAPLMPLIGYLASSLFIYHHNHHQLSKQSSLTNMLVQFKDLLSSTDLHILNREIKEKKGYAKQPYFLCLLGKDNHDHPQIDKFKQFYKYEKEEDEYLNNAVDTLIDYFSQRSSIMLNFEKQEIANIGKQFQQKLVGREIFNFQFTGCAIENLCFESCEIFNKGQSLNLVQIYQKIIANQKSRLIDIAQQNYLKQLSKQFFGGNKIAYHECLSFPMTAANLLNKHHLITEKIMNNTIESATTCMNLVQYKQMSYELRLTFQKHLLDLSQANNQKAIQLCSECFTILQNVEQLQTASSQDINNQFNSIMNKLELYSNECSQILGSDIILQSYSSNWKHLQSKLIQAVQNSTRNAMEDMEYKLQQVKVQNQQLKYSLKLNENRFRKLQNQYNIQLEILQTYKLKLLSQPQHNVSKYSATYTLELNKMRKKTQELQEQVKDNNLHIQELSSIIQKFQGLNQKEKDKFKFKFSKDIQECIQEVSSKVEMCYDVIKQAKQTNEMYEEIKTSFGKQKEKIQQQKRKWIEEINNKEAELKRLIKEKTILEQTISQSKNSINNLKNSISEYQKSLDDIQNTYTQTQCHLAQTESDLQSFKKALSLLHQQKIKGKSQNLIKFYKVSQLGELKQFLSPFLKK